MCKWESPWRSIHGTNGDFLNIVVVAFLNLDSKHFWIHGTSQSAKYIQKKLRFAHCIDSCSYLGSPVWAYLVRISPSWLRIPGEYGYSPFDFFSETSCWNGRALSITELCLSSVSDPDIGSSEWIRIQSVEKGNHKKKKKDFQILKFWRLFLFLRTGTLLRVGGFS